MNDEPESETHLDEIVISATSAQETRLPDSDDDRRLPRPDYDSLEKEQNLNFRERFAFCVQKITILLVYLYHLNVPCVWNSKHSRMHVSFRFCFNIYDSKYLSWRYNRNDIHYSSLSVPAQINTAFIHFSSTHPMATFAIGSFFFIIWIAR